MYWSATHNRGASRPCTLTNKAIVACGKAGQYDRGLAVLRRVPAACRDRYTYSAAIDLLKRRAAGRSDALLALQLLQESSAVVWGCRRTGSRSSSSSSSASSSSMSSNSSGVRQQQQQQQLSALQIPMNTVLVMLTRHGLFDKAKQVCVASLYAYTGHLLHA
jgi:hypothetical protein